MPKFMVDVREVWTRGVEIEADDIEDAISKVADGEGKHNPDYFDYSHELDPENWTAAEWMDE